MSLAKFKAKYRKIRKDLPDKARKHIDSAIAKGHTTTSELLAYVGMFLPSIDLKKDD